MDFTIVQWIVSGLLAVICFFLKSEYESLKESNKELWVALTDVKEKYYKKEDFLEFKRELWTRLDKMEEDFKQQLQELKK